MTRCFFLGGACLKVVSDLYHATIVLDPVPTRISVDIPVNVSTGQTLECPYMESTSAFTNPDGHGHAFTASAQTVPARRRVTGVKKRRLSANAGCVFVGGFGQTASLSDSSSATAYWGPYIESLYVR